MVCDSAGSELTTELTDEASLKKSLEELLKSMLRVWCVEDQAMGKLGIATTGIYIAIAQWS